MQLLLLNFYDVNLVSRRLHYFYNFLNFQFPLFRITRGNSNIVSQMAKKILPGILGESGIEFHRSNFFDYSFIYQLTYLCLYIIFHTPAYIMFNTDVFCLRISWKLNSSITYRLFVSVII